MISLSAVVWKMEPLRSSSSRRTSALIRLPLCAMASWPRKQSTTKGCAFFNRARAGGGITRVPEGARALEALEFVLPENLRDQPHVAMQLEAGARAVAGDDAGALLPAMLEGEEPVVGEHRRIRMTEDGEDAALVHRVGRLRAGKIRPEPSARERYSFREAGFPGAEERRA